MELKITKEKVLDAASKCSTAAATLKVLFPEAFEIQQSPLEKRFSQLQNLISDWLNDPSDGVYSEVYKKIDGSHADGKAIKIIELIKKEYNIVTE